MMQVFSAVNAFLSEESARSLPSAAMGDPSGGGGSGGSSVISGGGGSGGASGAKRIRTYTVVPLSPEVGVLEWVQNTIPIGNYLTDKSKSKLGAHSRFRPQDWPHTECRMKMKVRLITALLIQSVVSEQCALCAKFCRLENNQFYCTRTNH